MWAVKFLDMRSGVALGWGLVLIGIALASYESAFPAVSCAANVPQNVRLCVSARLFPLIISGIAMALVGAFFILRKPK